MCLDGRLLGASRCYWHGSGADGGGGGRLLRLLSCKWREADVIVIVATLNQYPKKTSFIGNSLICDPNFENELPVYQQNVWTKFLT